MDKKRNQYSVTSQSWLGGQSLHEREGKENDAEFKKVHEVGDGGFFHSGVERYYDVLRGFTGRVQLIGVAVPPPS